MLRRLLTLLAILTGFTAAGTPAYAAVYTAASGVEVSSKAEKACKREARECRVSARQTQASPRCAAPCKPAGVVTIVIPAVQMGIDRAFE